MDKGILDRTALAKTLEDLAKKHLENLEAEALQATEEYPEIHDHLKETSRRLKLAKLRELMDDHQTHLAFRLTVRNIVKDLLKEETKG
ncbi:hypothetical protein [Fulvivirga lutea]|uniref:Uncharacterized protein n=1 Tax=Fulvivirga lutea TaxID=2810512 RepID=A0A974ZZR1_9BACT|nr:hypothetical protein [Fulvivirga lutea]QSE96026.1 hypothetical protein JR347_10400 [Fulvivirga lutea]